MSFSLSATSWAFWDFCKSRDFEELEIVKASRMRFCKTIHCCWLNSIACQFSIMFVVKVKFVKLSKLLKLLIFCFVRWSISWLFSSLDFFDSIIVIDTKITRDTKKSRSIMSKNDFSDCRFLIEFFRDSKFEKIEFEETERKRFVLKTNDFEKNELFELTYDDLKLKKKACL